MQQLISESQARNITGGRKPLVPLEYETAVNALIACQTIDDAKYWDNYSDALAAYAKMHKSKEIDIESRKLKLIAYRKMGILAGELRRHVSRGGIKGSPPGPQALLIEKGLNRSNAQVARRISKVPERDFEKILARPRPPSPWMATTSMQDSSDAWKILALTGIGGGLIRFRSFCRANPAPLGKQLRMSEATKIKEMITECTEWLDELEQYLPKEKQG